MLETNKLNKKEAMKIYMAKSKEELAEMLWACGEILLDKKSKVIEQKEEETETEITYNDAYNYIDNLDAEDVLYVYNRFYSISDEYYESLKGDVYYTHIFNSLEDLVSCSAMSHTSLKDFAKCLDGNGIDTSDTYFLLEVTADGQVNICSGDEVSVLSNFAIENFIDELYDALFANKITSITPYEHTNKEALDNLRNDIITYTQQGCNKSRNR